MALLFMDSFDHYVTADLLEKWSFVAFSGLGTGIYQSSILANGGRRGSDCLRLYTHYTDNPQGMAKTLTPSGNTVVVGFAVKVSAAPTASSNTLLQILQGMALQATLLVMANGTLQVTKGSNVGTVLGASTVTLPFGVFSYLELKLVLDTSTSGSVEVRLNGAPTAIISASGLNTAGASATTWTGIALGTQGGNTFVGTNGGAITDWDDLYVLDGSGGAPWNTFLGDCRVDPRYTTAEVSCAWTPKTGTDNSVMVRDHPPDDDGSYNGTTTVGATDTFVVEDAPVAGSTVYGVQVCLSHKKADAGPCTIAPVVSGVTGTGFSPGTSYGFRIQPYSTNPATSVAWTEAGFNAAEFGYTRTA